MLVLLDNSAPRGLAQLLKGRGGSAAVGLGGTRNGELLDVAEQAGFEVLVTTDKNIRYQQNLKTRKISLVVLEHSQWPMVKLVADKVVAAVNDANAGSYVEVEVPFKDA